MKQFLANLSIRNKLVGIILVPTVLSLGTGFAVVILGNLEQFEEDLIETTGLVAHAVGNYSALALAFDDHEEAASAFEPLERLDDLTDVFLYDSSGRLFDSWSRSKIPWSPGELGDLRSEVRDGHVHHVRPVIFDGRQYGTIYVRATAEPLKLRTREYLTTMGLLSVLLVTFAVAAAYGLQRFISVPILGLAEQAKAISDHADYTVRVEKTGNDEIGELYDGFNAMLSQIQLRQEELERSNRDLDQFAYVASHDLKAPLRAISTLTGWIEEEVEGAITEDGKEQLRLLKSRVHRMDSLIEGILQYSRVGRLEHGGERVDARELLDEVIGALAPPAGLTLTVGDGMPVFVTRRLRLEQVFSNLINNAVKYHDHPESGTIEVTVEREGEFFRFTVADDGPGIDESHHEKIFLMFQTLQPQDSVGSTGLGLALVKKLVEEEGGKVTVESSEGQGATFRFTWPAVPPESMAAATA
ncbi:MAG: ATP-binding protein [Acidobacteriota bacterium]